MGPIILDHENTNVRKHESRRGSKGSPFEFGFVFSTCRAVAPLLKANAQSTSAEVRATIRRLLTAIEQNAPASPELAREVRAMKVLELVASTEAIKLLEQLAQGVDGAARTRAAKDALARLAKSTAAAGGAQ
jgi:hypothetical protein